MRMVDLINKKKRGEALSAAEIDYIVQGYTKAKYRTIRCRHFDGCIFQRNEQRRDGKPYFIHGQFR